MQVDIHGGQLVKLNLCFTHHDTQQLLITHELSRKAASLWPLFPGLTHPDCCVVFCPCADVDVLQHFCSFYKKVLKVQRTVQKLLFWRSCLAWGLVLLTLSVQVWPQHQCCTSPIWSVSPDCSPLSHRQTPGQFLSLLLDCCLCLCWSSEQFCVSHSVLVAVWIQTEQSSSLVSGFLFLAFF